MSPTVDAGTERTFRLRYRLGFHTVFCGTLLLCSNSAPTVLHLCAPSVPSLCSRSNLPGSHDALCSHGV